jgi:hypothetical protein
VPLSFGPRGRRTRHCRRLPARGELLTAVRNTLNPMEPD